MSDPYDRELGILADLEHEVARAATARLAAAPAPAPPAPRRRHAWRLPRRTAILVGLACLVSATATATVLSNRDGDPSRTADVAIAHTSGPDGYELTLHAVGARVCTAFVLRDSLDTICAAPPRGAEAALVRSATGPFTRYVYGLTTAPAVDVRVGDARRRVNTQALKDAVTASVPPARGLRFFVVAFTRGGREDPFAVVRVQGRGAAGRAIVDCSLGQLDGRC